MTSKAILVGSIGAKMRACAWLIRPTKRMNADARLLLKANSANCGEVQILWSVLNETKKVPLRRTVGTNATVTNNEAKAAEAEAGKTRNARSKSIEITTLKSTAVAPNGPTRWPNAWLAPMLPQMLAFLPRSKLAKSSLCARMVPLRDEKSKWYGNVGNAKRNLSGKSNQFL